MLNFPIDSTVNKSPILTKDNHDSRNTPHEQYISKWNFYPTTNPKTVTNKWTKFAEINYEEDNNTGMYYLFDIISEKPSEKYSVSLSLGNTGISSFNYKSNTIFNVCAVFNTNGTSSSGKTLGKCELYVQLYKSYNPVYIIPTFCKNTEGIYTDDYAFTCLKMMRDQPLLDSVANTTNPTDLTIGDYINSTTWGSVSVNAGATNTITINDTNIKWNSVVSYSISVPCPDGLILSVAQLKSGGGGFYLKATNITAGALTFPSCTISWRIRQI